MEANTQVTELLVEWESGKPGAFDQLFSLVYQELCALASGYMRRERSDHTLQTTALVNEAYIKLVGQKIPPSRVVLTSSRLRQRSCDKS